MSGKNELKEKFADLIKNLVMLCPAYNRASRILLDMRGKTITEIDTIYPELFQQRLIPLLCEVFDVIFGVKISVSGFGKHVTDFIEALEKTLKNEEKRKALEYHLGIPLSDPCRDYVKLCMDTLKEKDPTTAKLLTIIDEYGRPITLDKLLEISQEKGLNITGKTQLITHLTKLAYLNLISISGENVSPSDKYGGYAKEFIEQ